MAVRYCRKGSLASRSPDRGQPSTSDNSSKRNICNSLARIPTNSLDKHERSCYLRSTPIHKGQQTRQSILDEALQLASVVGLDGLSIGSLAGRLGLSKSGLYAHFKSKDALQLAILERGVEYFGEIVVTPARAGTDPVEVIRGLFEGWLEWSAHRLAGGCLFVTAAVEYDDRPGPVRDYLVAVHGRWIEMVADTAERAIASGSFRADLDVRQFAYDFNAALLAFNQARRLLGDPNAETKAHRALERLLRDASRGRAPMTRSGHEPSRAPSFTPLSRER